VNGRMYLFQGIMEVKITKKRPQPGV
jgi:hypothetical protein